MRFVGCLVIAAAACSSDPTSTYELNGVSHATNAWSGAAGLHDSMGMANVAWQIWFTNTSACPPDIGSATGVILIISSAKVTPPSTQLPDIGGEMELPVMTPPATVSSPLAYLNDNSQLDSPTGTLTLTHFESDSVSGSLMANATNLAGVDTEYTGTFTAPACPDTIHD
jgi:hypothetical protein